MNIHFKNTAILFVMQAMGLVCIAQPVKAPDLLYGSLFTDVQMHRIFPDNKAFADATPKQSPVKIMAQYKTVKAIKDNAAFEAALKKFVEEYFIIPAAKTAATEARDADAATHIGKLWEQLTRQPDTKIEGSSLLALPHPYIVPGGRFREIYYWDSYFTMLGLKEAGRWDMIENMVENFAYLIRTYGHIPNGNRSYYLSRSQPPFFCMIVQLLAAEKGDGIFTKYKKELLAEYNYWMDKTAATKHVLTMPDGSVLNRYYDQGTNGRQESFFEDITLVAKANPKDKAAMFRNLRSGAESGWDFSSRWFADGKNIASIQTTNLVPVDLNCLLYQLEMSLSSADKTNHNLWLKAAEKRKAAINKYLWSAKDRWYFDYNITGKKQSAEMTLAGITPFFFQVAPAANMPFAAKVLEQNFLKPGGLVTTLKTTGQQWDAPNGWAPLQWMAVKGLVNYGQNDMAKVIAGRWLKLCDKVYANTGKMMEKYNVVDDGLEAGGGEYPGQDGFGWTNGVYLALKKFLQTP